MIAGAYRLRGKSFSSIFLLCFAAYSSHLVIDLLGPDGRPPIGIPIFWPISDAPFISPEPVLIGVEHASSSSTPTGEWIKALVSLRNFAAIIIEVLIAVPFIILGRVLGRGPQFRKGDELPKGQS
jgi:hypothetical protein